MLPHTPGGQNLKSYAERRLSDVRLAQALRLAAHVIEIFGADNQLTPGDIPLILMRPVNAREARAAAGEIATIRDLRRSLHGTVKMDNAVVDPDGGRTVRDTEVGVLRTEAHFVLCGGLRWMR